MDFDFEDFEKMAEKISKHRLFSPQLSEGVMLPPQYEAGVLVIGPGLSVYKSGDSDNSVFDVIHHRYGDESGMVEWEGQGIFFRAKHVACLAVLMAIADKEGAEALFEEICAPEYLLSGQERVAAALALHSYQGGLADFLTHPEILGAKDFLTQKQILKNIALGVDELWQENSMA